MISEVGRSSTTKNINYTWITHATNLWSELDSSYRLAGAQWLSETIKFSLQKQATTSKLHCDVDQDCYEQC